MHSFLRGTRAVLSQLDVRALQGSRRAPRGMSTITEGSEGSPVNSHNEWDPLEETIVGTAEGMRVPFLHPNLKAKTAPDAWKWILENANQAHDPAIVKQATKECDEFVRVLELEGVTVRRPEAIPWDKLGSFKTPFYEDGGHMNTTPRDGILVVGDEIIEAPMAWRSRMFEFYPYRRLFNEYFKKGAKWIAAPSPTKRDELYVKDFPFEDEEAREKMAQEGRYILTEEEVAFDAADVTRCGTDLFISISNATNRTGVEWLRRHLGPKGYRVHSFIYKGIRNVHSDVCFIPLRPGIAVVNPFYHMTKLNDVPETWDWFSRQGWTIIEAPESVVIRNVYTGVYVSQWIYMNTLSLDHERVIVQKGETLLVKKLQHYGFKPIEVDFRTAVHLGGAFHCWTCDIRRRGSKETYFDL